MNSDWAYIEDSVGYGVVCGRLCLKESSIRLMAYCKKKMGQSVASGGVTVVNYLYYTLEGTSCGDSKVLILRQATNLFALLCATEMSTTTSNKLNLLSSFTLATQQHNGINLMT